MSMPKSKPCAQSRGRGQKKSGQLPPGRSRRKLGEEQKSCLGVVRPAGVETLTGRAPESGREPSGGNRSTDGERWGEAGQDVTRASATGAAPPPRDKKWSTSTLGVVDDVETGTAIVRRASCPRSVGGAGEVNGRRLGCNAPGTWAGGDARPNTSGPASSSHMTFVPRVWTRLS